VTGTTNTDADSGVQDISIGLQLAPGSDLIATDELSVRVFAEGQTATSISSNLNTTGNDATVSDTNNHGSLSAVDVIDDSQTYYLAFESDSIFGSLGSDGGNPVNGLPAGNEVTIEITTGSGSTTEVVFTAPDPITSGDEKKVLN
jgi:archaellin